MNKPNFSSQFKKQKAKAKAAVMPFQGHRGGSGFGGGWASGERTGGQIRGLF